MTPTQLDGSSFDGFVARAEVTVIGFLKDQAGVPAFAGLADATASRHPGTLFGVVAKESHGLFEMFGLSGDAIAIFRERVVLYLEPGLPDAGQLDQLLQRVAALDIRSVHAEIEQRRAAEAALATHRVCPVARRGKLS